MRPLSPLLFLSLGACDLSPSSKCEHFQKAWAERLPDSAKIVDSQCDRDAEKTVLYLPDKHLQYHKPSEAVGNPLAAKVQAFHLEVLDALFKDRENIAIAFENTREGTDAKAIMNALKDLNLKPSSFLIAEKYGDRIQVIPTLPEANVERALYWLSPEAEQKFDAGIGLLNKPELSTCKGDDPNLPSMQMDAIIEQFKSNPEALPNYAIDCYCNTRKLIEEGVIAFQVDRRITAPQLEFEAVQSADSDLIVVISGFDHRSTFIGALGASYNYLVLEPEGVNLEESPFYVNYPDTDATCRATKQLRTALGDRAIPEEAFVGARRNLIKALLQQQAPQE